MPARNKYLRRYTHLESLRQMLCTKCVTLLDYRNWEDKNDSYFLEMYQEQRKLKSLLVLCLTSASERFHLWHVFGPKKERRSLASAGQPFGCRPYNGASPLARIGVRIRFDRSKLIEALANYRGKVRWGPVDYLTHAQLEALATKRNAVNAIERLPFIKRYGFRDELEFRILFESTKQLPTVEVPIPIACVNRIIFSYKLRYNDYRAIRDALRSLDGCARLDIRRSNLTESKTWKTAGQEVVRAARQALEIKKR